MNIEEQIEEIMDHFDFDRVHKAMTALSWGWAAGVPDTPELRKCARELLREVAKSGFESTGTGGFVARNRDGWLALSFEVDSWYVEPGGE